MVDTALIRNQVFDIACPVVEDIGFELIDVEYLSMNGRWILRLYVDKEGGITIDDCVSVSRELGDLLDVKDVINNEYVLEVSSPGLNRPLKKSADFERFAGQRVRIKMVSGVQGRRNFLGKLIGCTDGLVHLDVDGVSVQLPLDSISKAHIEYEFTSKKK